MNERGTYGHGTLASGTRPTWSVPPPLVGVSTEVKREAVTLGMDVFLTTIMTLTGAWIGGQVAPKEPARGGIIGAATGFFAFLRMKQNSALNRIADHTRDLSR